MFSDNESLKINLLFVFRLIKNEFLAITSDLISQATFALYLCLIANVISGKQVKHKKRNFIKKN